jgi:glycosyltransferase involved in cell wall biosynthesis
VLATQNGIPTITADAHRLTIATIATDTPMGAQAYQEQIAHRAGEALESTGDDQWLVRRTVVRSMRSPLPGTRRLPMSRVGKASPRVRRHIGRLLYPTGAVTHRMNLELPPGPHADVVTLHDIVAWLFADESAPVAAAAQEAREADAVICVSAFTAAQATDLLGIRNPHVVHNGVDERFFDAVPLRKDERAVLGVSERYVLHAGGASSRKNLEALAQAWPAVHREHPDLQLVLAGPAHPRRTRLFDRMPGTHLIGRVDDATVPGLVAAAQAVVVPSLYEGFGLPVLEAMAANVPVVAANTSSLPEVAGTAAVLVEPTGEGIADGLLTVTSGDSALAALVRAGRERAAEFTWERSAREHARIWRSVA